MAFFWAIMAGTFNALVGVNSKAAEVKQCRPASFAALYLVWGAVASALLWYFFGGAWGPPGWWLVGVGMGAGYMILMRTMVAANRNAPPSLVWLLANIALVIPVLLGPVLLKEHWQWLDLVILLVFAAMLYALQRGTRQSGEVRNVPLKVLLPLLSIVFFANGLLMLGYKLKGVWWAESGAMNFSLVIFGSGLCFELLYELVRGRLTVPTPGEWLWGSLVGAAATTANLSLLGAVSLSSIVLFSFVQGISLGLGILLMILIFREKLTTGKLIAFALGLAVLALALCR